MSETPLPLQPLPSQTILWLRLHEEPNVVAAYEKTLEAEAQAIQDGANEDLTSARVAGHFLLHLYIFRDPIGDYPFKTIIGEIMQPPQDREDGKRDYSAVFEVGRRYQDFMRVPCTFE